MKKFILFTLSFVILFTLFQLLSGMLLTAFYTPDVSEAWSISGNSPQEIAFGESLSISNLGTVVFTVLATTIAYLLTQTWNKRRV
jgi:ABC-type sulfate transport system permease component